jgi:hypothetical protein
MSQRFSDLVVDYCSIRCSCKLLVPKKIIHPEEIDDRYFAKAKYDNKLADLPNVFSAASITKSRSWYTSLLSSKGTLRPFCQLLTSHSSPPWRGASWSCVGTAHRYATCNLKLPVLPTNAIGSLRMRPLFLKVALSEVK